MSRSIVAGIIVLLTARSAAPQEEKKASGGDETQSFDSPLPLAGGFTLAASKDKTTVTLAMTSTVAAPGLFWQFGISGTADKGESTVFTNADGFAPGVRGKVGLGYSSFLAEEDPARDAQVDLFMREAWCIDAVRATAKTIGTTFVALPDTKSVATCRSVYDYLPKAFETWKTSIPAPKEDDVKAVAAVIPKIESVITAGFADVAYLQACDAIKDIEWAKATCRSKKSLNLQARKYPLVFQRVVTIPSKAWDFLISANWTPTITATKYRPIISGVADLSTEEKWRGLLNGGTLDASVRYRRLSAGGQFSYADKLDEKKMEPVDVCERTTDGAFYADRCRKAAIGEPDPFASAAVSAVIALDPIMSSFGESSFRPGVQLTARWERLAEGKKRYLVSIPLYLARINSPFDLVVGVKPTYEWVRGPKPSEDFAVSIFLGARP
jgi:hypothetical protein